MDIHSKEITLLPHTSGVYLYKNSDGDIIYVGKAVDIQKRVKQYFETTAALSSKTQHLVKNIAGIDHISTISEFDALLLEAKLISTYEPKYNMVAKDDKSPMYIHIPTETQLPIITLVRKPLTLSKTSVFIGPFQSSRIAKQILTTIRAIIPYCRQKIRKGRPCFYTHLGLCDPCPSAIVSLELTQQKHFTSVYRKNIFLIKNVLTGKSKATRAYLTKIMNQCARINDFERAAHIRNQIHELDNLIQTHFDPSIYTTAYHTIGEAIDQELEDLQQILTPFYPEIQPLHRIECIDISQTSGALGTGALVVLENGISNTSLYRRFAIQHIVGQNDIKMIQQVITRRCRHHEWQFPNLLIVDGGKGQLKAAYDALSQLGLTIPVIGLAKRFERIIVRDGRLYKELHIPITHPAIHVVQRIRDESHRFAHQYHVLKRKKAFLKNLIP